MVISKSQAEQIWKAHHEIEKGTNLLKEIDAAALEMHPGLPEGTRGFQLGVPMGVGTNSLYNVHPSLAREIVVAHIENNERLLIELSAEVRDELRSTRRSGWRHSQPPKAT